MLRYQALLVVRQEIIMYADLLDTNLNLHSSCAYEFVNFLYEGFEILHYRNAQCPVSQPIRELTERGRLPAHL